MKAVWQSLLMALALATQAHASKIIGNGGKVVVCDNSASPSGVIYVRPGAQLLDFYEASVRKLTIQDPGGGTYEEKVNSLILKMVPMFPDLAEMMQQEFRNFLARKSFFSDVDLEDTEDSYHAFLPKYCKAPVAARQKPPMFPIDPWFIINADLWSMLDDLNKAGLVIHEVLFRIGLRNGVEHSLGVRYLVGLFFSKEFYSFTDEDWISGFLQTRLMHYEMARVKLPLFMGEFKNCEPLPGETNCQKVETLKPARFNFIKGRLQDIEYASPRIIEIAGQQNSMALYSVSRIAIDRSRPQMELVGRGDIVLSVADAFGSQVSAGFQGRIQPGSGRLIGTLSASSSGHAVEREVSDSFSDVIPIIQSLSDVKKPGDN